MHSRPRISPSKSFGERLRVSLGGAPPSTGTRPGNSRPVRAKIGDGVVFDSTFRFEDIAAVVPSVNTGHPA